eukprot:TRINITY_DN34361_c0_g2_i1.p1 TRINITY_DN34361_c0_g2~~TRINITY_DN34361_c0_g2_i1.p1  ORF type:complete len:352 (-),score=73.40 TRINITY_DN34361_c0_g2_i1:21-1013(-)
MGRRKVIFSDVDGTLVHQASDLEDLGRVSPDGRTFFHGGGSLPLRPLPPSGTGMQFFISERTLQLVAELRRAGHIFVLISGARSSTFLERLPFLPAADAYVMENGGRIFMQDLGGVAPTAAPLVEDLKWREVHAGASPQSMDGRLPAEREGALWDLYRRLEADGWACDTRNYFTNFRINLKKSKGKTEQDLRKVISDLPPGLVCSFNLGSADFYPATSGKDKAAEYLMEKFGVSQEQCVSMGDDDNDILLSRVVRHTYVPGFTSDTIRSAVAEDPSHFTVARIGGFMGTEDVLESIVSELGGASSFGRPGSIALAVFTLAVFLARRRSAR